MTTNKMPDRWQKSQKWQKKDPAKVRTIDKKKIDRNNTKSIYYKGAVAVLTVFMCYFSILYVTQHLQKKEMESRLFQLEKEIKEVKNTNYELQKEVELLYNPEYIESLARTELGLIKSGEIVFDVNRSRYVYQERKEE